MLVSFACLAHQHHQHHTSNDYHMSTPSMVSTTIYHVPSLPGLLCHCQHCRLYSMGMSMLPLHTLLKPRLLIPLQHPSPPICPIVTHTLAHSPITVHAHWHLLMPFATHMPIAIDAHWHPYACPCVCPSTHTSLSTDHCYSCHPLHTCLCYCQSPLHLHLWHRQINCVLEMPPLPSLPWPSSAFPSPLLSPHLHRALLLNAHTYCNHQWCWACTTHSACSLANSHWCTDHIGSKDTVCHLPRLWGLQYWCVSVCVVQWPHISASLMAVPLLVDACLHTLTFDYVPISCFHNLCCSYLTFSVHSFERLSLG